MDNEDKSERDRMDADGCELLVLVIGELENLNTTFIELITLKYYVPWHVLLLSFCR